MIVLEATVFDNGMNLIPTKANESIVKFLEDANAMAKFAPAIYDFIKKWAARGDTQFVADFSAAAEKLMKSGELVLSVEKKTGDLLPQLRSAKTGQIFENARIKAEQIPQDMTQPLVAIQMQVMMANIMDAIELVAANVEALRIENQADRIAMAESAWQQLQQAMLIEDSRLREMKILDIASAATEARCTLQGNFRAEFALAMGKEGKAKDWGKAANTAMVDLTVVALMAKTEYAAYQVLEEPGAANAALGQFKQFILDNKLEDAQTLRRLNSYSKSNREDIVRGFVEISGSVVSLQIEDHEDPTGLFEAGLAETEVPDLTEQDDEGQE
ncbi:MAG: zinc ribbon domain-containing protein [Atopobiaceae bacterium]|nr:zinc ribbon domain-containing protein [Atopobiaceae bacterium]